LGERLGWLPAVLMGAHRCAQHTGQARALDLAHVARTLKTLLGLLRSPMDRLAQVEQSPFRLAYELHEHLALPPALAAKAPHGFVQLLVKVVGLTRELCGPAVALLCHAFNQLKGFFVPSTGEWHR